MNNNSGYTKMSAGETPKKQRDLGEVLRAIYQLIPENHVMNKEFEKEMEWLLNDLSFRAPENRHITWSKANKYMNDYFFDEKKWVDEAIDIWLGVHIGLGVKKSEQP